MTRTPAASPRAAQVLGIVDALQQRLLGELERRSGSTLASLEWLRDEGRHGGGRRFVSGVTSFFNRAAVNVSSVHYDDEPSRALASATALSTIIHPRHPLAPSLHLHLSFTELRSGAGSWRLMADLNPSHEDRADTARFEEALRKAAPALFTAARAQGDRYFFIPALGRHRGVTHFYVEDFSTPDFTADLELAARVGVTVIDTYSDLLATARPDADDAARARQLEYHTLYAFQVLTLDRGTTSGLLVHDQNDLGIMGSLPSFVDRALFASWGAKVPPPQDELVRAVVDALVDEAPSPVTDEVRVRLAQRVRAHYRRHPEALALQASGDVVPPTVANHR